MARPQDNVPDDIPLSNPQAAALLGVSTGTLNNWMNEPGSTLKRREDGKLYISDLGEWVRKVQVTKPASGRGRNRYPYAPPGWGPNRIDEDGDPVVITEDKNSVEIRLKTAQAEKVEMENQVTAGTLIPIDKCMTAWKLILGRVRSRLLRIPSTVAPLVHGDPDVLSIQQKLKEAVYDALSEAAEDWREETGVTEDE